MGDSIDHSFDLISTRDRKHENLQYMKSVTENLFMSPENIIKYLITYFSMGNKETCITFLSRYELTWNILYPYSYEILKRETKMLRKPSPGTLESYLPRKQRLVFNVNNRNTKKRCQFRLTLNKFHKFSNVFIVDCEQIIVCWVFDKKLSSNIPQVTLQFLKKINYNGLL